MQIWKLYCERCRNYFSTSGRIGEIICYKCKSSKYVTITSLKHIIDRESKYYSERNDRMGITSPIIRLINIISSSQDISDLYRLLGYLSNLMVAIRKIIEEKLLEERELNNKKIKKTIDI